MRRPGTRFVSFANSIVAANRVLNPGARSPDCSGAGTTGHSPVGDTTGCATGPTDITGKAPLAANGRAAREPAAAAGQRWITHEGRAPCA